MMRWDEDRDGLLSKREYQGRPVAFVEADVNEDNVLHYVELTTLLGSGKPVHYSPYRFIKERDHNSDGLIDRLEWPKANPDAILFYEIDLNANNILTREEVESYLFNYELCQTTLFKAKEVLEQPTVAEGVLLPETREEQIEAPPQAKSEAAELLIETAKTADGPSYPWIVEGDVITERIPAPESLRSQTDHAYRVSLGGKKDADGRTASLFLVDDAPISPGQVIATKAYLWADDVIESQRLQFSVARHGRSKHEAKAILIKSLNASPKEYSVLHVFLHNHESARLALQNYSRTPVVFYVAMPSLNRLKTK